jgi:hypothetical protein
MDSGIKLALLLEKYISDKIINCVAATEHITRASSKPTGLDIINEPKSFKICFIVFSAIIFLKF